MKREEHLTEMWAALDKAQHYRKAGQETYAQFWEGQARGHAITLRNGTNAQVKFGHNSGTRPPHAQQQP